jgi:hypothetical protein
MGWNHYWSEPNRQEYPKGFDDYLYECSKCGKKLRESVSVVIHPFCVECDCYFSTVGRKKRNEE